MAGFPDLVPAAQPAYYGDGVSAKVTEGATWRFEFTNVNDDAGDPINLTSATCTAVVLDDGGTQVVALDFTGSTGSFVLSATAANTAGLAAGTSATAGRRCKWTCRLSSAGNVVQVWGPSNSPFIIFADD